MTMFGFQSLKPGMWCGVQLGSSLIWSFSAFNLTKRWLKNEQANAIYNRVMYCEKKNTCSPELPNYLAGLEPCMGTLPEYSVAV